MPEKRHNLAIILYGLRFSTLPYAEKLKKLSAMGYRSIQACMEAGLGHKEHAALLSGLGMEVCCMAGGLDDVAAAPGEFIAACRAFQCDEVMIGSMLTDQRMDYEGYGRAIDMINKTAGILKKEGVYLGYHNHAQEFRRFPNGIRGIDLLFDTLDPECVRFMPDTHWIHAGGGDILWWLNRFRGRIRYLHVKDYRVAPANFQTGIGDTDKQFSQIGGGNLPWREIIDTATNVGVKAFIVEQDHTYGEDPFRCAEESFNTLSALGLV